MDRMIHPPDNRSGGGGGWEGAGADGYDKKT